MSMTTITNLDDFTMGVPADEVSINVNKVTLKRAGEKIEVRKCAGGYRGRADHTFKWTGNIAIK